MERPLLSPSERRRQEFLSAASLMAPLAGALLTLAFLGGYLIARQWQWLALALLSGAVAGLFLFSRFWLSRGRPALAAVWLGLVNALFWSGLTVFVSGISGLLVLPALLVPLSMAFLGAPPRLRPRLALALEGVVAALAVLWLEFASPVARLVAGAQMRWLLPWAAFLLIGALVILPASGYPLPLQRRLIVAVLLAAAAPVLALGVIVWPGGEAVGRLAFWSWLAVAFLSAGLAWLIAVAVSRTILLPLRALGPKVTAETVEAAREPLPVLYEDEIGALTAALNGAVARWQQEVESLQKALHEQRDRVERRALQARAVSEIARRAAGGAEEEEVLQHAAHLLRQSFDLYHAGIYLLEEDGEFAILRAAGDEAGKVMVANRYRVARGSNNPVGLAMESGELYLIADVSTAPSYVHSPLLPYTQCEVAVPLKVGERIVGVLDLHSEKVAAFDEEELTVVEAVADYLAMVVERTRLRADLQRNMAEMERLFQQLVGRTWQAYTQGGRRILGYRYADLAPEPLEAPAPEDLEALRRGQTVVAQGEDSGLLATPIKLRGQTLGVLTLRYATAEAPSEMVAFVEEAAERLALALENARLLEDAQRLAARERLIGETSARLRATLDLENVLQTAVREFQRSFGLKEAEIRIQLLEQGEEVGG